MKKIYLSIIPLFLLVACGSDKEEGEVGTYQITNIGDVVCRLNTATGDIDLFEPGYRPMVKELPQQGSRRKYEKTGDSNATAY